MSESAATPSVREIRERVNAAEADGWYGYGEEARADVRFLLCVIDLAATPGKWDDFLAVTGADNGR